MSTIVTRSGKGVPLTATDHDNNVNNLNTDKVENLSDLSITATSTELNYVDGVTSAIQTQIDAKLDSTSTLDATKLTGALPAISGASLTALNGTQVTSGTVPAARLPAGCVIQVVSELNNTELAWTDGSQQTVVTDSITVQEGNKVFLNFFGALSNDSLGTSSWSSMAFLYLYQNSSNIRELEHDGDLWVNSSNNHRVYNVSGSHLTGALSAGTYAFSLQVDPYEANSFSVNRSNSHPSSMILMEIQV